MVKNWHTFANDMYQNVCVYVYKAKWNENVQDNSRNLLPTPHKQFLF